jgi:hypothetical protein
MNCISDAHTLNVNMVNAMSKIHQLVQPLQPKDCAVKVDFCHWIVYNNYFRFDTSIPEMWEFNQWRLQFNIWTNTDIQISYFLYLLLKCNTTELHATKDLLYFLLVIHNYILSNLLYRFNTLSEITLLP